ncbi:MAG: CBS domain-containing protein [Candidatus Omnitrophota bacterium]|jgi:CBS domain-containing protein
MSKTMPTIQKYMTAQPHTIKSSESLINAEREMSKDNIRHLPVVDESDILIGIISDRDIKMAESIIGSQPSLMTVGNVCHKNPYEVSPNSPLDEVVATMAENHYESAVVTQNNHIVGIFTTMDVCKALKETLQTRYH